MLSEEEKIAEKIHQIRTEAELLADEIRNELGSRDLSQLNGIATGFHRDFEELLPDLVHQGDSLRLEDSTLLTERLDRVTTHISIARTESILRDLHGVLANFHDSLKEANLLPDAFSNGAFKFTLTPPQDPPLTTGKAVVKWLHEQVRPFRKSIEAYLIERLDAENPKIDNSVHTSRAQEIAEVAAELFENEMSYAVLAFPREANHSLFTDSDPTLAEAHLQDPAVQKRLLGRKSEITFEVVADSIILTIESPDPISNYEAIWEAAKTFPDADSERGRGLFLIQEQFPEMFYSEEGTGSRRVYIGALLG